MGQSASSKISKKAIVAELARNLTTGYDVAVGQEAWTQEWRRRKKSMHMKLTITLTEYGCTIKVTKALKNHHSWNYKEVEERFRFY